MTAASKTEPRTFAIIDPRFPMPGGNVSGELAFCPSLGTRVARTTVRDSAGHPLYQYFRIHQDKDIRPESLNNPGDEIQELVRRRQDLEHHPRHRVTALHPSALEREIQEFSRQFPLLADHFKLIEVRPPRLFEPGTPLRPIAHDPAIGVVDWPGILARHCGGDGGEHGRFDPAPLQDAETQFLIGLAPQGVRNAYAITRNYGVVLSEFKVPDRPVTIHVATALGSFTLMTASVRPA